MQGEKFNSCWFTRKMHLGALIRGRFYIGITQVYQDYLRICTRVSLGDAFPICVNTPVRKYTHTLSSSLERTKNPRCNHEIIRDRLILGPTGTPLQILDYSEEIAMHDA